MASCFTLRRMDSCFAGEYFVHNRLIFTCLLKELSSHDLSSFVFGLALVKIISVATTWLLDDFFCVISSKEFIRGTFICADP